MTVQEHHQTRVITHNEVENARARHRRSHNEPLLVHLCRVRGGGEGPAGARRPVGVEGGLPPGIGGDAQHVVRPAGVERDRALQAEAIRCFSGSLVQSATIQHDGIVRREESERECGVRLPRDVAVGGQHHHILRRGQTDEVLCRRGALRAAIHVHRLLRHGVQKGDLLAELRVVAVHAVNGHEVRRALRCVDGKRGLHGHRRGGRHRNRHAHTRRHLTFDHALFGQHQSRRAVAKHRDGGNGAHSGAAHNKLQRGGRVGEECGGAVAHGELDLADGERAIAAKKKIHFRQRRWGSS